jgi:hypothetical protein
VSICLAITCAPCTAAPEGSVTRPLTLELLIVSWADTIGAMAQIASNTGKSKENRRLSQTFRKSSETEI